MTTGPEIDTFVSANGVDLHYTEWNPGGADTTLMVHGLNTQLHTWDPIAVELAATRRVICVDLRGHGRSSWPLDGYAVQSFVGDLVAMLAALDIDEIQYVGHSIGARVGIAFAATWTGRLRHVLLSDCGPEIPQPQALALQELGRTRPVAFDSRDEALNFLRAANPAWRDEFHLSALEHQYRTNWVGRVVPRADPELRWLYETEIVDGNPFLWESWPRITAPITLLWGSDSGFLDDELVERMRRDQPTMTVHRPNGSHWYLRESPHEFLRYAETVLTPLAGSSS